MSKVKEKRAKSSVWFKFVLSLAVVLCLLMLGFFFKTTRDLKAQGNEKTVAVVVMEEKTVPQEPRQAVVDMQIPLRREVVDLIEEISAAEETQEEEVYDVLDFIDELPDVQKDEEHHEVFEEPIADEEPEEEEHQEALPEENRQYYVSIVVDDMGVNQPRTREIISIRAPLTSSFLTYGKNLEELYEAAQEAGHEIMMHTPMEPKVEAALAPDTLKVEMSDEEIAKSFLEMLSKFDGVKLKGINNHMGSRFTESAAKLDVVMRILKQRGLFFLDSKTSKFSQGQEVAKMEDVAYVSRDVFLDNENDYDYIMKQLKKTEKTAFRNGKAVAICHPKSETVRALRDWVESLENKPIKLVVLSELIEKEAPQK